MFLLNSPTYVYMYIQDMYMCACLNLATVCDSAYVNTMNLNCAQYCSNRECIRQAALIPNTSVLISDTWVCMLV